MAIDPEDFEAWREHPTTRAVFKALDALAEERRQLWIAKSWGSGECDERQLAMLKGQAEAFAFLPKANHAQVFGETE